MWFNIKIFADLHVHGKYSRATSQRMCIREINRFAELKGLNLIATGDFTHPKWLKEIEENLFEIFDTGFFKTNENSSVNFILETEVSTIFSVGNETKKIHHVILTPNMETARQINDRLSKYGDLSNDGRPMLNIDAPLLVEEIISVSDKNMIFPAHIWTPWFSIFGAFSGFDTIEECYQDMAKHIYALETGLSSDPPMNWRLSNLDKFTLLSNSDCHSYWPWRIGREANVFDLEKITYNEIITAIRFPDRKMLKFTIETMPAYGKYHWSGHRKCNISVSPEKASKLGNICPVCRKQFTKGVEQRVEELADRFLGYKPEDSPSFMHLLPLSEIISVVLSVNSLYSKRVWEKYDLLVKAFGNEYNVLITATKEDLCKLIDVTLAEAILKVREGKVKVNPGFDGVYGKLFFNETDKKPLSIHQSNITDFIKK